LTIIDFAEFIDCYVRVSTLWNSKTANEVNSYIHIICMSYRRTAFYSSPTMVVFSLNKFYVVRLDYVSISSIN